MMNVALLRVLYTHALAAAPRLALGHLAPLGRLLGDPPLGSVGFFLDLRNVFPRLPARRLAAGRADPGRGQARPPSTTASSVRASPSCMSRRCIPARAAGTRVRQRPDSVLLLAARGTGALAGGPAGRWRAGPLGNQARAPVPLA